jgi:hypothetical protein
MIPMSTPETVKFCALVVFATRKNEFADTVELGGRDINTAAGIANVPADTGAEQLK